jgi:hypothetical protein
MLPQSITNLWEPARQEPKTWYEEAEESVCSIFPSMTYQQRLLGCMICMGLGFLLSMGSTFRLVALLKGDPIPFATMYTLGNIIALSATCFIYGPWAQAKQMFAETRFITTCVFFGMMIATLSVAFYPGNIIGRGFILVICIFCQFCALAWYTMSFVPYAREMVGGCIRDRCCPGAALPEWWTGSSGGGVAASAGAGISGILGTALTTEHPTSGLMQSMSERMSSSSGL